MSDYARRDDSRNHLRTIEERHLPNMRPNERALLAQRLLVQLATEPLDYGDFQSVQAVQRYIRRARNEMRGLSLS